MEYTKEKIEREVETLGKEQAWNHDIELPFGVRTIAKPQKSHGKNLVKWKRIKPYLEKIFLEGKRVLDVGCSDGFFSLKMRECGAKEAVGIDADINRINKAKFVADVCKADNLFFKQGNIFDSDFKNLGHFDFVLCLGFLHRIPEVYTAIKVLTSMSDTILFEWKALKYDAMPVMEFRGAKNKDGSEYSNLYWAPSISLVVKILKTLGFKHNFAIEDRTDWRRAILISSQFNHPIFRGNERLSNNSKLYLLYKYSKIYLANLCKILTGKIKR